LLQSELTIIYGSIRKVEHTLAMFLVLHVLPSVAGPRLELVHPLQEQAGIPNNKALVLCGHTHFFKVGVARD